MTDEEHLDSNNENNVWKEYKDFLDSHELQLYGMGFPTSKLGEKLYYKLKYDVFEPNVFKIIDNQSLKKYQLVSNVNMIADNEVYLVDHCWTFKIREYNNFVNNNPDLVERLFKMLKYADNQHPLTTNNATNSTNNKSITNLLDKSNMYKELDQEILKSNNENNYYKLGLLEYDNLDINDSSIKDIFISKYTWGLSLEGCKLRSLSSLTQFLILNSNIKAIWIDEDQFNYIVLNDNNQEEEININIYKELSKLKNIELINRNITSNCGEFTAKYFDKSLNKYLTNNYINTNKYNSNLIYYLNNTYLNKKTNNINIPNMLDISYSNIFSLDTNRFKEIINHFDSSTIDNVNILDLTCCDFEYNNQTSKTNNYTENLTSLLKHLKNVNKLIIDFNETDLYDLQNDEDNEERLELNKIFCYVFDLYNSSNCNYYFKNITYINEYDISLLNKDIINNNKSLNTSKEDYTNKLNDTYNTIDLANNTNYRKNFEFFIKKSYVKKYMWKIISSYRLVSEEKYDESITWFINEEIGSTLYFNHSDTPNMKLFPFIFSKDNNFNKNCITYSLLWPCKNINKDNNLYIDCLSNVTENLQRSSKLTLWFDTPNDYFKNKFISNVNKLKLNEEKNKEECIKFDDNIKNLKDKLYKDIGTFDDNKKLIKPNTNFNYLKYKDEIKSIFDFTLLYKLFEKNKVNQDKITFFVDMTVKNIIKCITDTDFENNFKSISTFFSNNSTVNVVSDLIYVKDNLSNPFNIVEEPKDADILWLNMDYHLINPYLALSIETNKIKNINFKNEEGENKNPYNLKNIHFTNQYSFESIVTSKYHLMKLIQSNKGISNYYNLSYDLDKQLAELIGNYQFNENPYLIINEDNKLLEDKQLMLQNTKLDNSWILKPINMSRSMDMIVTNNLFEIIKASETGPKICQKYMDKPFLFKGKKFDFRYMVLVKSLLPLDIYIYSKVFWFRIANNSYTLDVNNFTEYETHFTVMNYDDKAQLNQIFDYEFLEYLKEKNVSYDCIYNKICDAIKDIFNLAAMKCPQMISPYAKAIYAIDVMIDEYLEPKILEFNFSPDCTRACKYTPSFFNDIFSTLYLNKAINCTKI